MKASSDTTRSGDSNPLLRTLIEAASNSAVTKEKINDSDKERTRGPRFPVDTFFAEWFRRQGKIYSFVFLKNHKVTNIQVAELIALMRSYRRDDGGEILFLSYHEYKQSLMHIADDLCRGIENDRYNGVDSQYSAIINKTAVIDVMYGSCVVYLPPGVQIDLGEICARSGYIHSCGRNIFIQNIYKATKEDMYESINEHLGTSRERMLFRPYSHEDFTANDRAWKDDTHFDLDDVKLAVQKTFLGKERIADVIEDMRKDFKDRLIIPRPGDSQVDEEYIDEEMAKGNLERSRCLFLIMDHSIDPVNLHKGNRHFIICYEQECKNENPFHHFDEDKPAWFDHTTLPHTLAGAMINITRPYWPDKRDPNTHKSIPILLYDCFVGSGTTLLEACKYEEVECSGSDYESVIPLLIEDNLRFFSLTLSDLETYLALIDKLISTLTRRDESRAKQTSWLNPPVNSPWKDSMDACTLWKESSLQSPESSSDLMAKLNGMTFESRLLFYARLKVLRRYEAALHTNAVIEEAMLQKELEHLKRSTARLIALRRQTESGMLDGCFRTFQGLYSQSKSIDISRFEPLLKNLSTRIEVQSCTDWRPQSRFDVIITDPPYGFNTVENPAKLASIYASFLRTAIQSLADEGQLVLALPDWSHTGRHLPEFILKGFVKHQVFAIAEEEGREVIHSASQVPETVGSPPYYWESEKALRRAILHFRFRKRVTYRRGTALNA